MPLRDDRRGRRATIAPGKAPLRPDFSSVGASTAYKPVANDGANRPPDTPADAVRTDVDLAAGANPAATHPRFLPEPTALAGTTSAPAQPRSLLEPADVLSAMARPLVRIGSAMISFIRFPIAASSSAPTQETLSDDTAPAVVVERSFADEVASLLQIPIEAAAPQGGREAPRPLDRAPEPPIRQERALPAALDRPTVVAASSEGPAPEKRALEELAAVVARVDTSPIGTSERANTQLSDRLVRDEPAEEPVRNSVHETRNAVTVDDGGAEKQAAWADERSKKRDGSLTDETTEYNIVVARIPRRPERAVPITRLPLRPQGFDITWMAEVPEFARAGPLSRTARHELLERFIRNPGSVSGDAIVRAYQQEEGGGRAIALRVLLRNFPQAGRSAFVEALRVGSDDERALAVDGLTAIGAREELTPAFSDRVDAIAAKAALSYVGTLERTDYRAALSPFIDETRIEAILKLLAGIVE